MSDTPVGQLLRAGKPPYFEWLREVQAARIPGSQTDGFAVARALSRRIALDVRPMHRLDLAGMTFDDVARRVARNPEVRRPAHPLERRVKAWLDEMHGRDPAVRLEALVGRCALLRSFHPGGKHRRPGRASPVAIGMLKRGRKTQGAPQSEFQGAQLGGSVRQQVRWELGRFAERASGRLPDNPSRIAPIEFGYLAAEELLFLERIARGHLLQNFGSRSVISRMRATVQLVVDFVESEATHRYAEDGGPASADLDRALACWLIHLLRRSCPSEDVELSVIVRQWTPFHSPGDPNVLTLRPSEVDRFAAGPESVWQHLAYQLPEFLSNWPPCRDVQRIEERVAGMPDLQVRVVLGDPEPQHLACPPRCPPPPMEQSVGARVRVRPDEVQSWVGGLVGLVARHPCETRAFRGIPILAAELTEQLLRAGRAPRGDREIDLLEGLES